MPFPKTTPAFIRDPQAMLRFGLCTASLAVLYYPVLRGLVHDWINLTDDSLAFLAPLVSFYLIWQQLEKLERLPLASAAPVHEAIGFLLEHLPRHMHLVLLTRADPPLPLARMRARHQLVEIRIDELRFHIH